MKAFALAATVAAGLLCSAGTADAQYRSRGSYVSSYPSYSYPTYSYAVPRYYSPVVTSSYAAPYVSSYTPGTVVYSGGSYYDPTVWSVPAASTYPAYSSPTYYPSGVYVSPSGVYAGRRGWRW
jgi:hypothetical protein